MSSCKAVPGWVDKECQDCNCSLIMAFDLGVGAEFTQICRSCMI